jgi:hypothetical protein
MYFSRREGRTHSCTHVLRNELNTACVLIRELQDVVRLQEKRLTDLEAHLRLQPTEHIYESLRTVQAGAFMQSLYVDLRRDPHFQPPSPHGAARANAAAAAAATNPSPPRTTPK